MDVSREVAEIIAGADLRKHRRETEEEQKARVAMILQEAPQHLRELHDLSHYAGSKLGLDRADIQAELNDRHPTAEAEAIIYQEFNIKGIERVQRIDNKDHTFQILAEKIQEVVKQSGQKWVAKKAKKYDVAKFPTHKDDEIKPVTLRRVVEIVERRTLRLDKKIGAVIYFFTEKGLTVCIAYKHRELFIKLQPLIEFLTSIKAEIFGAKLSDVSYWNHPDDID